MPVKPPSKRTTTVDVLTPRQNDEVPLRRFDTAPRIIPAQPSAHTPANTVGTRQDLDAITAAPLVAINELASTPVTIPATAQRSLEAYRVAPGFQLPQYDESGLRSFKGRMFVDTSEGIVQVARDFESGLYRARLMSESSPSGPTLVRDADSRLWFPIDEIEATTFALTANRLDAFRSSLDFTGLDPDSHGLYRHDGKLYAVIDDNSYQVLHDVDASSAHTRVMRLVRSGDPVAQDENNIYVATRVGRSEPVFFHPQIGWTGLVIGGAGGMRPGQTTPERRSLTDRLSALMVRLLSPVERVRRLYPSFGHEEAAVFLQSMGTDISRTLSRQEAEYKTLKHALKRWSRAITESSTKAQSDQAIAATTEVLRGWRRETGTTLKLNVYGNLPAIEAGFGHIRTLELRSIRWTDSADTFLSSFTRLESLTIAHSDLKDLPAAVSELPHLTSLSLHTNRLRLDESDAARISALVKLEKLDLSGNELGVLPDFSAMSKLRFLDLSRTEITLWPTGLQRLPRLTNVDLRHNRLSEVPAAHLQPPDDQLEAFARVNGVIRLANNPFPDDYWRHFDAYWERLESNRPDLLAGALPGAFECANPSISRVQRMFPAKTSQQARQFIRTLGPDSDAELIRMENEFLTLSSQLRAWSFSGGGARQRYVRAGDMQLQPEAVGPRYQAQQRILQCWRRETPQMQANDGTLIGLELDLSGLTLASLPDLDVDFGHVGSLRLSNMGLSASPEGFLSGFRHVRWLDLSNNQLRDLPPAIGEMQGMTRLNLHNNQIVLTPQTAEILGGRTTLRALTLTGNPLGMTLDFSRITDMRSLNMSGTGIDTWPTGLAEQPLLDTVMLRSNRFTTLPDSVIAPSDEHLTQTARVNNVTDATDNPFSDATLEQIRRYGERLTAAGITTSANPNRLVVTAQTRTNRPAASSSAGASFQRWTNEMPASQIASRQTQWQALAHQPGAEPLFEILSRLETGGAGHADMQRRVWDMLDSISENSPESEKLRDEMFDRAGQPACCDRAAFSFGNLEVLSLIYKARQQSADRSQGQDLADFSRRLYRLHEVDAIAALDIQRSEAIVRDLTLDAAVRLPHIMRLREEVEIRLAYRFGLKDRLQLPGQPKQVKFTSLAGVTPQMLDAAYEKVIALDHSPEERQALLSRDFWQDFLTAKYREQFEKQRSPFQDRVAALHNDFSAQRLMEADYKTQTEDLLTQLAIEEATLMQALTRQELDEPAATDDRLVEKDTNPPV